MSEDFRVGCWAKVERADEHIQNFHSEERAFFLTDPKPYRIVRKEHFEGRGYEWHGFEERPVPPIFAVLAGEAIHQLRSSLDHLVCAMVRERGNVIKKHMFPVTRTPEDFEAARKDRQIDGISDAARTLIERAQPYNTGDVETSILWTIHREDIADKHKLLAVVSGAAFMSSMTVTQVAGDATVTHNLTTFPPKRLTKEGVQLLYTATPYSHADPQVEFSHFIAFEKFGTIETLSVIVALHEARNLVIDIINRFAGEFAVSTHIGPQVAVRDRSYLRQGGRSVSP